MNLFEKVVAKSNEVVVTRCAIVNEIVEDFKKYIDDGNFTNCIERRLSDKNVISEREFKMTCKFWEYHSGCSGTYFGACGWKWKNPECDEYSTRSYEYKGVRLKDVQDDVTFAICDLIKNEMRSEGFEYVRVVEKKNNLGLVENEIIIKW